MRHHERLYPSMITSVQTSSVQGSVLLAVEDCSNWHASLAGGGTTACLNRNQPRDEMASGRGRHTACRMSGRCRLPGKPTRMGLPSAQAKGLQEHGQFDCVGDFRHPLSIAVRAEQAVQVFTSWWACKCSLGSSLGWLQSPPSPQAAHHCFGHTGVNVRFLKRHNTQSPGMNNHHIQHLERHTRGVKG